MKSVRIDIKQRQYLELENLALGAFSPLHGFMKEDEFTSVVQTMHLPDGQLFPLPVVLDLTPDQAKETAGADRIRLIFEGKEVGEIIPKSVFSCDKEAVADKIFGTRDTAHPGVAQWLRMGGCFVGGPVSLDHRVSMEFSEFDLTPAETRAHFTDQGWDTIVGFQTRNVPHRAHEYLLRLALERSDGLFIQPLVGLKKRGDFTPAAILASYKTMIADFLPEQRILLGILSTTMRYAGPREALLHAIVRRNYGCTHFIVGRDHAGVGNYYSKYQAQELAREHEGELGIEILYFAGPFYCSACDGIVTERTCPHEASMPQATDQISGTNIRAILAGNGAVANHIMRSEIVASVQGLPIFIEEDSD